MQSYRTVLTIAGSDPSAGAGIQADLKTCMALNCYGLSVLTALTAQSTQGVSGVHAVPVDFVKLQLTHLADDIHIQAIKTGMLYQREIIIAVAEIIKDWSCKIVIDPVMTATSGALLLEKNAVRAYQDYLFPLATMITPNIPEAEILLGRALQHVDDFPQAAMDLAQFGSHSVLIKGGHLANATDTVSDYFYVAQTGQGRWYHAQAIATQHTHGTGCTLSAAIAAYLAQGLSTAEAIAHAKAYLSTAIAKGANYQLGKGNGPLQHHI